MSSTERVNRYIYIAGAILLIGGVIDPLEGSVLIGVGGLLLALAAYRNKDKQRKLFGVTSVMIVLGVAFLFFFSSLGGFGGNSTLSWWWGLLILPYPIGWVTDIIILLRRAF